MFEGRAIASDLASHDKQRISAFFFAHILSVQYVASAKGYHNRSSEQTTMSITVAYFGSLLVLPPRCRSQPVRLSPHQLLAASAAATASVVCSQCGCRHFSCLQPTPLPSVVYSLRLELQQSSSCRARQTSALAPRGVQHPPPARGLAPALLVLAAPVPPPEAVAAGEESARCG